MPRKKQSAKLAQSVRKKAPKKTSAVKKQQGRGVSFPLVLVLAIIGANLILAGSLYLLYRKTILSFQASPVITAEAHLRKAVPKRILIERLSIDLTIEEAAIENGVWQTSDTFATHLNTSARPGEGNNVVIYGHNRRQIFAPLKNIKKGDTIQVHNNAGDVHEYQVDRIDVVEPTAVEKVLPTSYEVLTVYTCTGFLDSQRLVVTAHPTRVTSQ